MSDYIYRSANARISLRIARAVPWASAGLGLILTALFVLSLALGSYDLSLAQVWQSLVGMMLGLSGALLQGVTRNPLADPSLVGVSQGASLAVVALIVIWPDTRLELRPVVGFGGALAAAAVIQWIAAGKTSTAALRFILVGIGVSALISAVTNAMLTYGEINQAAAALAWLAGSVHTATWRVCAVLALGFVALIGPVIWAVRPLSALRFGPEVGAGLGLHIRRDRAALIALAVALAAIPVSMAGPLGFIGLIAPQLARRMMPSGVASHLLVSALVGGALVAASDLVGRVALAPIQLPAGLICAVIGAPVFVLLILKRAAPRQY